MACELCDTDGGVLLVKHKKFRVIAVDGNDGLAYPGFCRVVWNEHVREMSDLADADRALLMNAVYRVEAALRLSLQPDKINLASLGNATPHLHWHVIPRFSGDATFPKPIWAAPIPSTVSTKSAAVATLGAQADWQNAVRAAFVKTDV